jgi:hypothetical protein
MGMEKQQQERMGGWMRGETTVPDGNRTEERESETEGTSACTIHKK